jgi:hypothetical protein
LLWQQEKHCLALRYTNRAIIWNVIKGDVHNIIIYNIVTLSIVRHAHRSDFATALQRMQGKPQQGKQQQCDGGCAPLAGWRPLPALWCGESVFYSWQKCYFVLFQCNAL